MLGLPTSLSGRQSESDTSNTVADDNDSIFSQSRKLILHTPHRTNLSSFCLGHLPDLMTAAYQGRKYMQLCRTRFLSSHSECHYVIKLLRSSLYLFVYLNASRFVYYISSVKLPAHSFHYCNGLGFFHKHTRA